MSNRGRNKRTKGIDRAAQSGPATPRKGAGRVAELGEKARELEVANTLLKRETRHLTLELRVGRDAVTSSAGLFDQSPAALMVHDAAGELLALNPAARKLFGLEAASPGFAFPQLIAKESLGLWLNHFRKSLESLAVERLELTLRPREGREIPVEIISRSAPDRPGDERRVFSSVADLTHQRERALALASAQPLHEDRINRIQGMVWEVDVQNRQVTFVSRHTERLLGYSIAAWKNPEFWTNHIYAEDRDATLRRITEAVEQRKPITLEYRVVTAGRRVLWLCNKITPFEREGRLMLCGIAIEITERHHREAELREMRKELERRVAERTAELGRSVAELETFSYSISHDLRAPIRAMLGFATLAAQSCPGRVPSEILGFLERIAAGARRADQLIQDVLTYSRISREEVRLEPIDPERLVRELISQLPDLQPPLAEVEVRGPMPKVWAHEARLGQCLSNLLLNAAKFVAPGQTPKIEVGAEPIHDKVRIYVRDQGIGIAPANLTRIFRMFERVNPAGQYPGTGIGLAIVSRGAERLGGRAGVESQPGQGSRFWLELNPAS